MTEYLDRGPLRPAEGKWMERYGLAVLRLDRLRALVDVYEGTTREDEMVGLFDYCLHGRGGAAHVAEPDARGPEPRA